MTLTCGSLFSGIGGLDLAAEWASMKIEWQCEIDPFCRKVLKKHWPGVKQYGDITKLDGTKAQSVDVIFGGFPCQPYSIAGNRKGDEDDRALWDEFFRVASELRPTWVVGENVGNFANMGLGNTLSDLESIGYQGQAFIIPALAVGAPHRRDRLCIVAHLCNADSKSKLQAYQERNPFGTFGKSWRSIAGKFGEVSSRAYWETDKPSVCRMDDGIPDELDKNRLIVLGNTVVPQAFYPVFQAIADIESGMMA